MFELLHAAGAARFHDLGREPRLIPRDVGLGSVRLRYRRESALSAV